MGWLSDMFSGAGDLLGNIFGGDGGGGGDGSVDWGSTTPFDAITSTGWGPQAADFTSTISGLVDTPNLLSGVGDFLSGSGGLTSLLQDAGGITKLLGGGGGGGSGPNEVAPVTVTGSRPSAGTGPTASNPLANVPGLIDTPGLLDAIAKYLHGSGTPQTGGGKPDAGSGSGGGGGNTPQAPNFFGSLLNNGLAFLPGLMQAINAKDQKDLGPDAAALRAMATGNQHMVDSLSAEAQANKMGNLPGPAMQSLGLGLAAQKAGFASRYNQMGMSGSSAEAADMADLNAKSEADRFQIGMNMANESLAQVQNLNSQDVGIYSSLMDAQTQRDKEYMDAMSGLAEALGKSFSTPSGAGGATPIQSAIGAVTGNGLPPGLTSTPIDLAGLLGAINLGPGFLQTAGGSGPDQQPAQANVPDLTDTSGELAKIAQLLGLAA